jgi:hypothetical protein
MQVKSEEFDSVKEHISSTEHQFQSILSYFEEKIAIEGDYNKDLQKLAKKYPNLVRTE